jgi:hypothetical protein
MLHGLLRVLVSAEVIASIVMRGSNTMGVCGEFMEFRGALVGIIRHCRFSSIESLD